MEGIFGVGLAEVLIVGLVLFIIGGPQNTAKWARELGRWTRKARETLGQVMAELEREIGPEGKELVDATRELAEGTREVRRMSSPRRAMGETMRLVEESVAVEPAESDRPEHPALETSQDSAPPPASGKKKYRAWLPPDQS
jgi:Sec-independent protein translocase protein TatA